MSELHWVVNRKSAERKPDCGYQPAPDAPADVIREALGNSAFEFEPNLTEKHFEYALTFFRNYGPMNWRDWFFAWMVFALQTEEVNKLRADLKAVHDQIYKAD